MIGSLKRGDSKGTAVNLISFGGECSLISQKVIKEYHR